jgi:CMP-N-acetylneuraminic acid synthetase
MKVIAVIPIKKISKRVKSKNFKIINKKPLYRFLLDKLKYTKFDEIYVDSDSEEIKRYCKKNNFFFLKRKKKLAEDNANGNDLLNYHAKSIDADIYFQLFVTAPLLSVKSINSCINLIKKNKRYDSIFTVNEIFSWFWFNKKPVNYEPKILPRSQDAKPIIQETTGLYGIKRNSLLKYKCRIGHKPYMYKVSEKESLDIDNKEDLEILKTFLKA